MGSKTIYCIHDTTMDHCGKKHSENQNGLLEIKNIKAEIKLKSWKIHLRKIPEELGKKDR